MLFSFEETNKRYINVNISFITTLLLLICYSNTSISQVRYIFKNTSSVNQQSYSDNEIYLYTQLGMPGMNGYFNTTTQTWENINTAGSMSAPSPYSGTYTDANIRLDLLPTNADGQYYLDLPFASSGRIYVGFGGPIYTVTANNPLLDVPSNPNYNTKIETIEMTVGGQIFTNTSRVDRYAYPMGEELYCNNGAYYDKVGETLTHEQVIAKWKLFVNDDFQNAYDPLRDIISQMGHASYFQEGGPGNDYFDAFIDDLFSYYSTHTLTAEWENTIRTGNVSGTTLTLGGTSFDRSDFNLEDIVGGAGVFNNGIGQILGVCINRGVIQLTEDLQVWDDENLYFTNPVKNDYTHFFHSDFVSFNALTYALAYDDVFNYSSTQSCQGTADSVVISLGGFGTEHTQVLSDIYITPQNAEVDQYKTIQLAVNGLDQGLVDMDIPIDAIITWSATAPDGSISTVIDQTGFFGPTTTVGDYTITATAETTEGSVFTTTTIITVNQAGTTSAICSGELGNNADYELEVIGSGVYLTLIPNTDWVDGGFINLHYDDVDDFGNMAANPMITNQPYFLDGFFEGEEVYFYTNMQFNGNLVGPIHIENIGTCDGLEVLEEIIYLETTDTVTIQIAQTYQIEIDGVTNKMNTVTYPDPLFVENLSFSGIGVDANGLFTPINGAGTYDLQVNYDEIIVDVIVIAEACSSLLNLGTTINGCNENGIALSLPTDLYTNISWTGSASPNLDNSTVYNPIFMPTTPGLFVFNISALDDSGCNATGSITVDVLETSTQTIDTTVCDSYISPQGVSYTASNSFSETFTNQYGCDSTFQINLTIHNSKLSIIDTTVCSSYLSPLGFTYTVSNLYHDTLITSNGCDSIIETNLTVLGTEMTTIDTTVCSSYLSPQGLTYLTTDIYYDTLNTLNGCDSIIETNLTVLESQTVTIDTIACDTYTSPKGIVHTTSSSFSETFINQYGCDSTFLINLTVNESKLSTIFTTVCSEYMSPLGNIYTTTGIYRDTLITSNGCDSIIETNLTVLGNLITTIDTVVCESYTSPFGSVLTTSGSYNESFTNASGCSSGFEINLTVLGSSFSTIDTTVCTQYISPLGVRHTSTGVFSETISSTLGCDSIITVNLTVLGNSYGLVNNTTASASEICQKGEWTHYIDANYSNDILFSIKKNGNDINCEVTIDDNGTYYGAEDLINNEAIYVSSRLWDVKATGNDITVNGFLTYPVSIRYYFAPSELQDIKDASNNFATTNNVTDFGLKWFKSNEGITFDPTNDITPQQLLNSYNLEDISYGKTNDTGVEFVQINGIYGFSGGGAYTQVYDGVVLSISDYENDITLLEENTTNFHPNPFSETITFSGDSNTEYILEIYTSQGVLIEKTTAKGSKNFGQSYTPGLYLIKATHPSGKPLPIEQVIKL